jgi:hypothetical protein
MLDTSGTGASLFDILRAFSSIVLQGLDTQISFLLAKAELGSMSPSSHYGV